MDTPRPVVVVGSFNQDLTWRCPEFPQPGQTLAGTFTTGPGGKGSNQAVACARAGVSTAMVGAVGRDGFGAGARAFWAAEGIACHLRDEPAEPTGNAGIWVNAAGQNEIIVALGANLTLTPDDLPAAALQAAQVVVCQAEIAPAATLAALRIGHDAGALTIFNPAPMPDNLGAEFLEPCSIFVPNESEFDALARRWFGGEVGERPSQRPPDALHALCRRLGSPWVIVTLGGRGALVSGPEGWTALPVLGGVEVVDTTGAGDAFVGGLAAGLVRYRGDVVEAARFATVVAGLSVGRWGTAPSMPHLAEIEARL